MWLALFSLGPPLSRLLGADEQQRLGVLAARWSLAEPAARSHERFRVLAARGSCSVHGAQLLAVSGFLLGEPDAARPDGHYARLALRAGAGAEPELELLRSVDGGERLYFLRRGELMLIASSLPLLLDFWGPLPVEPALVCECLISGVPLSFGQLPLKGLRELLHGQRLRIGRQVQEAEQTWPEIFEPAVGDLKDRLRGFRDALCAAVEQCAGPARPIPVALSGGIDSSAIAAAAVEVAGADGVQAITYEFDDVHHVAPETPHATAVVKALGIRRHSIFAITRAEFLAAIPEQVWRSESPVYWPKAFLLPVARKIKDLGFDRYLTGFGIGSHMGWLHDAGALLQRLPGPGRRLMAQLWARARFHGARRLRPLVRLHPGLEPPHPRLFELLLKFMESEGWGVDRKALFPSELSALTAWTPPVLPPRPAQTPIGRWLQELAFAHLISCIDITRAAKSSRELGVARLSPAHFPRCIPYAYLPPQPTPVAPADRALRPGKYLLREAFADRLPHSILYRVKDWDDAISSQAWRRQGRIQMLQALSRFPGELEELGPGLAAAGVLWEPLSIQASGLSFWLWQKLLQHRGPQPPTWQSLA